MGVGGGGTAAMGTFSALTAVLYCGRADDQHSPEYPAGQPIFHQKPSGLRPTIRADSPARRAVTTG
ncbi:MAG TPA: hypothetical protein EYP41_00590 [Anaerolineae bacterium]|nr:hypothetical protein [Anaerolineae bacterium]HIP72866.1 hypothetical protein [Anaerolineae bacterium]